MAEGAIAQVMDLEGPPPDIQLDEEGGAIGVLTDQMAPEEGPGTFYENLVPFLDPSTLETLAAKLIQEVEQDRRDRKKRDEDYAEAVKRTGLGKQAPGGATFEGASKAVHPMLLEACLDFSSRAIRELMPPGGPVKMFVPGDNVERDRLQKAERKKNFMNWQCIEQMPELRSEIEQLLSQLPLGGAMYLRLTPDQTRKRVRPTPTFVPLDYVTIPASASNYYTSNRTCYWEKITQEEYEDRVTAGFYIDVAPTKSSQTPEETESEKASDKVEGKEDSGINQDGLRTVLEVSYIHPMEPNLGESLPYLISIDKVSGKIISVVRNWEETDLTSEKMIWMIEWIFLQWRGAQGIGLGQAIGSIAGAATGALRALLDSAHIQNIPTLARLKGANFSGQSKTANATQIIDIEGGVAGDADIRKYLMPIPYNPPSEALFKLLGFLTDTGRQAIHVALDKLSENNKNLPVGTTLALIEEGMKVQSAIHLRMFHAMSMFIKVLHRIDRMYMNEEDFQDGTGVALAARADFEGPIDCIPTADPEIFSDVQRIAQAQILADRATALPQIYNLRATEKFLLERAKIPSPDQFLIPEPKPEDMNAVNENVAMSLGRPVTAFPLQDHLSHLQVLIDFILSPVFGQLPIIAPTFLPAALNHMKEHLVYWYANEFYVVTMGAMQVSEEEMEMVMKERDPEARKELDRTLAVASKSIMQRSGGLFKDLPMIIQMSQKIIEQFTPVTLPSDPDKRAEVERKTKNDQMVNERENKKIETGKEIKIIDLQERRAERQEITQVEFAKLSAREREVALQEAEDSARQANEAAARLRDLIVKERAEDERARAQIVSDEKRNTQDNLTALRVAAAEIESSEKVSESTGTGANKNPSGARPRG
jgi:hypothetical protein